MGGPGSGRKKEFWNRITKVRTRTTNLWNKPISVERSHQLARRNETINKIVEKYKKGR